MKKLTPEDIEGTIESETIFRLGEKTTVVLLTLKSGFEVIGTSACINPADYDQEIGRKIARARAIDKVWELEGYRAQVEAAS